MDYGQEKGPALTKEQEELIAKSNKQLEGPRPDLDETSPETQQKTVDGINEKQQEDKSTPSDTNSSSAPKTPDHPASGTGQQHSSSQSASPEQSMYARGGILDSALNINKEAPHKKDVLVKQSLKAAGIKNITDLNNSYKTLQKSLNEMKSNMSDEEFSKRFGSSSVPMEDMEAYLKKIGLKDVDGALDSIAEKIHNPAEFKKELTNQIQKAINDNKYTVDQAKKNRAEYKALRKEHFNNQLSNYVKAENDKGFFSRMFSKIAHPFKSVEQRAVRKMANDYGIDIKKPRRSGLMGRIKGALWTSRDYNINNLEKKYNKVYDAQNTSLLDKRLLSKNGRNVLFLTANEVQKSKAIPIPKPGGKGFFGGKGGKVAMMAGLVGLGAVISNMFSGGHQSNSQLYNPNPQPQYYS